MPGCDHKDHTGTVYLHSKCHTDKPTVAAVENGALRVACKKCYRSIITIQIQNSQAKDHIRCALHRNAGVFVSYTWNSGVLKVKCAKCDEEFLTLEVAARNTN